MEKKIVCPRCGGNKIWKAGEPGGKQQYQCKECRRKFVTELNYSKEFKRQAIQMFYEGNSGRAVGRIMGINKSTVYNCIKKLDEKIQNTDCTEENTLAEAKTTEVIEMDELFDYIKEKKQDLRDNVGNKKGATNRRL